VDTLKDKLYLILTDTRLNYRQKYFLLLLLNAKNNTLPGNLQVLKNNIFLNDVEDSICQDLINLHQIGYIVFIDRNLPLIKLK